jgi:ribosome biogenesis ATPase
MQQQRILQRVKDVVPCDCPYCVLGLSATFDNSLSVVSDLHSTFWLLGFVEMSTLDDDVRAVMLRLGLPLVLPSAAALPVSSPLAAPGLSSPLSGTPTKPSPLLVDRVAEELRHSQTRYSRMALPALRRSVQNAIIRFRTAPAPVSDSIHTADAQQEETTRMGGETEKPEDYAMVVSEAAPVSKETVGTVPLKVKSGKTGAKPGSSKRKRAQISEDDSKPLAPSIRYSSLGGLAPVITRLDALLRPVFSSPLLYDRLGVSPLTGLLLTGPSGVGKTALAQAIGGEYSVYGVSFTSLTGPELVSGISGESESRVRHIFEACKEAAPAILFIDEIDAIAPRREDSQRGMERRIVSQLLACMDTLSSEGNGGKPVVVIGATCRPETIDSSLRRAGRFDREISIPIPDEKGREEILRILTRRMKLHAEGETFDYHALARLTPGYVGADMLSLAKEAAACAVNRSLGLLSPLPSPLPSAPLASPLVPSLPLSEEEMARIYIGYDDFLTALPSVQPAATREGFATVPNVTWADVGALGEVRGELELAIVQPLKNPELFEMLGLRAPAGVLLYGPPGCGKTLLAKAVANETCANFISVKGPELLDKYVGESERAVRQVFSRARASAPCVIFFDELDSLAPRRGGPSSSASSGGVSERVVNQLLTELDGLDTRRDVFVLAATNRPDIIDPAMLRPGRLDKMLYVPLPAADERASILSTHTRRTPLGADVNLATIAADKRCTGFSGADLAGLVREASMAALKELLARGPATTTSKVSVNALHFEAAFSKALPSVSEADERLYNSMQTRLRKSRAHITVEAPQ